MTFTYAQVGATRDTPLPAGYHHLHHRALIGAVPLARAADLVMSFDLHRAAGVRVDMAVARVAPGVRVVVGLGLGPLRLLAPCEVVWTQQSPRRAAFAYGTLPGHPECGEEFFAVDLDADDRVWFTVGAFSRPARWFARVAGPLVPVAQMAYARHLARTLRRFCAR